LTRHFGWKQNKKVESSGFFLFSKMTFLWYTAECILVE
jgi:hypothetical protein